VDEPDPGFAMLVGLKLAVTPVGRPLAERAMALSNPPEIAAVMEVVAPVPGVTGTEIGFAVNVKAGVLADETVSDTVVVSVSDPPVPVTVMV